MSTAAVVGDRRQLRRQQTIDEVITHAVAIMGEEGVAGLSLGEIARRMGIKTPSLYVYFPSKNALYDALFERGWALIAAHLQEDDHVWEAHDLEGILLRVGQRFVRWCVEHPAYAQLLVWRPVPGFEPSAAAFKPAVEVVEFSTARFAELQDRGLLRADLDIDQVQRDWTVLVSGVVSQQLSNGPHDAFEDGRFTNALPELTRMFAAHYGVRKPTRRTHGNAR